MAENENLLAGMDPAIEEKNRQRKAKSSYDAWVKWCEKHELKLEKYIENITSSMLIAAAGKVVEQKRKLWAAELEAKNAVIRYAIENHQTLTDHYWQAERQAFQVYLGAQKIYLAIYTEQMERVKSYEEGK